MSWIMTWPQCAGRAPHAWPEGWVGGMQVDRGGRRFMRKGAKYLELAPFPFRWSLKAGSRCLWSAPVGSLSPVGGGRFSRTPRSTGGSIKRPASMGVASRWPTRHLSAIRLSRALNSDGDVRVGVSR